MCNLDRFSQPMSWEYRRNHYDESEYDEIEEVILCSCGCGEEIDLEDPESYMDCPKWEDHYYVVGHLEIDENDQSVGDQSNSKAS